MRPLLASALVVGLGASLGGCGHLPRQFANLFKVRPVVPTSLGQTGPYAAEDRLYADAVRSIDKRDYGQAIGLLQVARENRPGDPRVLTAMAVVYDKLGRFDLSDRYYDQAEKADPGSRIVALDRRYSMLLRNAGRAAQDLPNGVALAEAHPAPSRAAPKPPTGDEIYADAVQSIQKHEYGSAIAMLRQARDAMPGDARVLTALGVTYDHLGRFDLSSRYYDQAEKADPGSTVIAQDRRTSLMLQQHGGFDGPEDVVVLAGAAPAAKTVTVAKAAPSVRHGG
jgi:Flp pilus assembly protein TadD